MKKKGIAKLLVVIMALAAVLTFGACNGGGGRGIFSENVCYYGCPNSKRVKKLNLFKRR